MFKNKLLILLLLVQYFACSQQSILKAISKNSMEESIRVKRQYVRPRLDDTWLANGNERSIMLKSNRPTQVKLDYEKTEQEQERVERQTELPPQAESAIIATSTSSVINPNKTKQLTMNPKADVTVQNLALSLIGLFDRIKCTLYNVINQECKQ